MNKTACLLLIALLPVTPLVGLSKANFFPPPTSLPHIYIRSDGSLEPTSVPVQRAGNVYTFAGDLANCTLEIQRSNIVVDGAGRFLEGNGSGQTPSASANQSEPTFNPHSTKTFPIEIAYTLAGVLAIVAVGVAFMLRKRKTK